MMLVPDLQRLRFGIDTLAAVGEIDRFMGAWPALARMTHEQRGAMAAQAAEESAQAACRLEGLPGSETGNYAAALTESFDKSGALTEPWILSLHRKLLEGAADAGSWKTAPNSVQAFETEGKSLGAIFPTETPEKVGGRLAELLPWTEDALRNNETHPVIVIAAFAALFVEIHPFRAGTIRLASILTTALLVRAGYDYALYGSLDRTIEKSKYSYYLSLRRTLGSLRTDQPDWKHWLDFFLRALVQQTRDIAEKIAKERAVGDDLPELSARILAIARRHGRVTIAAAANETATSRNTIKDHVGRLVENGHLTLHGAGRGAWYGLR